MLVVHPSVKADNLMDFVSFAKARTDALNYAPAGVGTPFNLAAELFKSTGGLDGGPHAAYVAGLSKSAAMAMRASDHIAGAA